MIIIEIILSSKDNDYLNIDFCKPFAAHCLGYPLLQFVTRLQSIFRSSIKLNKRRAIREKNTDLYEDIIHSTLGQPYAEQNYINYNFSKQKNYNKHVLDLGLLL